MSRQSLRLEDNTLLIVFVAALGATVFIGLCEARLSALFARGPEQSLQAGTAKAYSGTAAVDLGLAHRALADGDLAGGERRVAKAQDKLYAPQLGGRAPAVVAEDMKELERRYGKEFKVIRRERALNRLGQKGAEVADKAGR